MAKQLPEITPSSFKIILKEFEKLSNPPAIMIYGVPGIGKTQIIKNDVFADKQKYEVRVKYLSRMDPTDWMGIPQIKKDENDDYTEFIKIKFFTKPEEGRRLVIFFDELNTATPQVLNSALDIILEKKNENIELPQDTIIVAAGNLGEEDGTYVEEFSSAVKTRLVQFILRPDLRDWLNWARENKIHRSIISFIEKKGLKYLIDMDGFKNQSDQIATPRGWERVSNVMNTDLIKDRDLFKKTVWAILGRNIAEEFVDFFYEQKLGEEDKERVWLTKLKPLLTRIVENNEIAHYSSLSDLIKLVNDGLAKEYSNSYEYAQKLSLWLLKNKDKLNNTLFSSLRGENLKDYIEYLEENNKNGLYSNLIEQITRLNM